MHIKRLIALITTCTIAFSVAGCGAQNSEETTETESQVIYSTEETKNNNDNNKNPVDKNKLPNKQENQKHSNTNQKDSNKDTEATNPTENEKTENEVNVGNWVNKPVDSTQKNEESTTTKPTEQKDTSNTESETVPETVPQTTTPPVQPTTPTVTESTTPSTVPPATKPDPSVCEHEFTRTNRVVAIDMPLFQEVEDTFECTKCGSTYSDYHSILPESFDESVLMTEAQNLIDAVNTYRANNGLSVLTQSATFNNWAAIRADEITYSYGHQRPDGSAVGFVDGNDCVYGENITYGFGSGYEALQSFQQSPAHNAWILLPELTGIGAGIAMKDGTAYVSLLLIGPLN